MKVITFANQKGGVGKSTLSINLVHAFKDKTQVRLVDFDLQGSTAIVQENGFTKLSTDDFLKLDIENEEGFVIVDTPPYLSSDYQEIMKRSDLVIIPTKPAYFDLAATSRTIEAIKALIPDRTKVALFLNMVNRSSNLSEDLNGVVNNFGIPIFKSTLSERVAFVRSVMHKDGVYSTRDGVGKAEFNKFVNEVLIFLTK